MVTSVVSERDKYSVLFLAVTRWTALLTPILVIIYGLMIIYELMPHSPAYSDTMLILVCMSFVFIGIVQFLHHTLQPKYLAFYLIAYHILGASYLFWGSGFNGPLTIFWVILLVISELLFGKLAAVWSAALFVATCLITFAFEPEPSVTLALVYLGYVTTVVVAGFVVSKLRGVQRIERGELKRTREHEELQRGQLLTLINSMGDAIVSTSSTGTIRIYNAALLNLLDTNQSLSGTNIDDVFNLYDEHGEPVSIIPLLKKTGKLLERDDLSHRFTDGESIRLDISCAPIRGHFGSKRRQHEGYIFILRDVSKEKSLEEERDEFISVVSHELRTPITITEGTISNLQLLMDRGGDPVKLTPALKEAHEQVLYLASMVNDLSTLSRAERGVADTPEEINVTELLHELYQRYTDRAKRKKLTLDIDAGPRLGTVMSSRLYLEEVLQNFLTNALKYTHEGSIKLSARRESSGIRFSIKDTGIGISKADQKHLFEKFYRAEDYRIRETAGTGLGLYVVQKLSQKLGIRVEIESRLNHGSTFSFLLPLTPPDTTPKHSDL
jgi:signal transduction histidine kinase